MSKKMLLSLATMLGIVSLFLGKGAPGQAAPATPIMAGQTISGPTLLPGMDTPPPPDQATVVDKRNPAWVTRYGTQAGIQFLPPRQATFEAAPQGPQPELGAWQTFDLSQAHTVNAVQGVPDGRVFAAVASNGLRVYAPTGDGSYTWSEIHTSMNGLSSNNVTCLMYIDGELWVGTTDSGISVLHLAAGTWSYFTTSDGLPSNYINRLTPVPFFLPDHMVMISTTGGAERYYFDGFDTIWTPLLTGDYIWDIAVQIINGSDYYWFATNTDVEYYDGANWTIYGSGNTGNCNMWRADRIVVDQNNTVWFASELFNPPLNGGGAPQTTSGL
jgi:hypothetical protein